MNIFKLFGSVFVDNEEANKSISKTDQNAQGLGKTLVSGAKKAGAFGLKVAKGAAVGGAALFALAKKTGDAADELLDLQSQTGMSTDELQRWSRVATVAGVDTNAMADASKKLTKTLDTMSEGSGKAAEAAAELGFSYEDLMAMDADTRMNEIVDALMDVEDTTERAKIGTDLFGGAWDSVAPILDVGADTLKEVKDNADIISEDDLNKANEFRIKVDEMQDRVQLFGQRLALEATPFLTELLDTMEENGPMLSELFSGLLSILESLMPVLMEVLGWINGIIQAAVDAIEWTRKMVEESREAEASGESSGVFTGSSKHKSPTRVSGFATGGHTMTPGIVKVGERGPELLDLPAGARVRPLDGADTGMGSGAVHIHMDGATFVNDQGVADLMDLMVDYLTGKGVQVV